MTVFADVVIVGSGPAGSVTSLLLARAGVDVLLLDRQIFPRAKPCGDCLSPQASRVLDELGILDDIRTLRPARLDGWRIVSPGGHAFSGCFTEFTADPLVSSAIAIERSRLDAVLLDAAKRAGARLWSPARVSAVHSSERQRFDGVAGCVDPKGRNSCGVSGFLEGEPFRVEARLVIGADGLRSAVARRLGLARPPGRRKLSLTAHVGGLETEHGFGEMHVGLGLCAGIAPVTEDSTTCNVTVVAESARWGRHVAADPVGFFRNALDSLPALRRRARRLEFAGAAGTRPVLLASGPFDRPARRITLPGFALVGDAAGYFDPFTGQGIYQALAGARFLADEAIAALRVDEGVMPALLHYQARHRALVRGSRLVQRMVDAILSRPGLADFAIRRLAAAPPARNALLAVTGDLAPARSVFAPATLLAFAGIVSGRNS
jgi:menaquinone-9 beta-reductase